MEALRFGVVGCGGRGASVAHLMTQISGVRLVAVCDIDEGRAREVGEQLNVPFFRNFEEMLAQVEMDAVYIATSVEHHFSIARRAILEGKHVLLEKMMTTSAAEAWELVRLAEMRGVCGAISYQLRFYPVFQKWRELGLEMQPLLIISSRNPGIMPQAYLRPEPWAGIVDFLTHDLDLVLWVAGKEPESAVEAMVKVKRRLLFVPLNCLPVDYLPAHPSQKSPPVSVLVFAQVSVELFQLCSEALEHADVLFNGIWCQ